MGFASNDSLGLKFCLPNFIMPANRLALCPFDFTRLR